MKRIGILGGTGFVGSHLVARMPNYDVRVVTRRPEDHRDLKVLPFVKMIQADIHDPAQLTAALAGCDTVINLVGILNENGNNGDGFRRAHVQLAQNLVTACKDNGIRRVLQMSALHADAGKGRSHYLRTKGEAEYILNMADNVDTTFFQPSVIFGRGDSFFNRFAGLIKLAPIIPVPCPNAQFSPVWVEDVVTAFLHVLEKPATTGRFFQLCGPKTYTHHQLWNYTADCLGVNRSFWSLNDFLSKWMAKSGDFAGKILPEKPFSTDNYLSLQSDSTCTQDHFAEMGITPRSIEVIVPQYLADPGGQTLLDDWRSTARRA